MDKNMKKLLVAERIVILQAFAEFYLSKKEGKTFAEAFPDIKDEYGILNIKQVELLHLFLKDVYSSFGLDLEKILAEKGEVFDGKELTPFEGKEIIRLADDELGLGAIILKRKERLYKKKVASVGNSKKNMTPEQIVGQLEVFRGDFSPRNDKFSIGDYNVSWNGSYFTLFDSNNNILFSDADPSVLSKYITNNN